MLLKKSIATTSTKDSSSPSLSGTVSNLTKQGPYIDMAALSLARLSSFGSSSAADDTPSVAESDVSSLGGYDSDDASFVTTPPVVVPLVAPRKPLQWEFKGLTLWVEYEEFDMDLTRAIDSAVRMYGTERIPIAHSTAIYGMHHLTPQQAMQKLHEIPSVLPQWPTEMEEPRGIRCDIAQEGRPGQVCNIAWSELSLKTNEQHEQAIDKLYDLFEVPTKRQGPWTPHISVAYDNPEDSVLKLEDTVSYVISHPTLLNARRIKAISLWNTKGKMGDWQCLDRVYFEQQQHGNGI